MRKLSPLKMIMLVDDDDTTNYLNQRLLEKLDAAEKVLVMKDGEEALNYLTKACESAHSEEFPCPDLMFLDIKMPVMDGFEFLEAYKNSKLTFKQEIVIMMLTSSASFYDLEKLKQFPDVKKHYSKSLTETDVKDIMEAYFPAHVSQV
ncbi:response regulator [Adhaeribacter sp. BT258]|uniref:Response regulator n=1 Tax=Adhaeribacter terrigena TaxID=2793070 RepID=A0ABS1BY47_9BACT|nr:response regulator [Adhaeribacter terrigena]MBK0402085.1 response regulator [Adhaeribacter terrigena]